MWWFELTAFVVGDHGEVEFARVARLDRITYLDRAADDHSGVEAGSVDQRSEHRPLDEVLEMLDGTLSRPPYSTHEPTVK